MTCLVTHNNIQVLDCELKLSEQCSDPYTMLLFHWFSGTVTKQDIPYKSVEAASKKS